MKIIFLDVDGVLNNDKTRQKTPDGYTGIDPINVEPFIKILEQTDAKIVLSSLWRLYSDVLVYMWKCLGELAKSRYIGDTLDLNIRELEIKKWLEDNLIADDKGFENYVILDDLDLKGFDHRFIRTVEKVGLTNEDAERAISILNGVKL